MGLVETVAEHVSVKSWLVLVPGLLLSYMFINVVLRPLREEVKLARMSGARPPKLKTYLPLSEHAHRLSCLGR